MEADPKPAFDMAVFERAKSTKKSADRAYKQWQKMVAEVEEAWGHSTDTLGKAKLLSAKYGPTIKRLALGVVAGSSASGGLVAWLGEPGTLGNIVSKLIGAG